MLIAYDFLYATSSVQPSSLCTSSGLGNPAFAPSITELPPPPAEERELFNPRNKTLIYEQHTRVNMISIVDKIKLSVEADEPNWQGLVSNESVSMVAIACMLSLIC